MSLNLPNIYGQQFAKNIALLVQQKDTRLAGAVTLGTYQGKQAQVVDQLGAVEMQDVTGRFQPKQRVDAAVDSRWIAPLDNDLSQMIDKFDKLRLLLDPKSSYVTNAVQAAKRKKDHRIINAFFAAAQTGETGATSTAFDATNQVVGVNTGGTDSKLNVAKLEAGRSILLSNDVDLENESIHVAIPAKDELSLRSEIQIISSDFNEKPVFNDKGLIMRWRGFEFHHSQQAALTTEATDDQAGSSRAIPMWVPSGMHLGIWNEIETDVDQRKDLRGHPWECYTILSCNATRTEEKKVVKIWCGG